MSSYINFYFDTDNQFTAEIHKDGMYRIIKNEKNLMKLLEISQNHGHPILKEGTLRKDAKKIAKEYDKYVNRKNRLRVLGKILKKMQLSRKNPTIGKTIVTASLLAVIAFNGLGLKKQDNATALDINSSTSQSQSVDDELEYLDTTPEDELVDEFNVEEKEDKKEEETPKEEKVEVEDKKKEEDTKTTQENKSDQQTAKVTSRHEEINRMFESSSFHFSFEDRSSKESMVNAKRYEDIFEKYAKRYGMDKNLLMAIAAQESSGEHYNNLSDKKPAAGIMQIEKAVHIGHSVSAYNFETGKVEKVNVTKEKLQDLESNIQIGSMILREYIENCNYNIPLAIQTYNMGPGNMSKVLSTCSASEKIDVSFMRNNPTNNKWLNYRSFLNLGDAKYTEHVFSYLGNKSQLEVKKRDNQEVKVNITNDYLQNKKLGN